MGLSSRRQPSTQKPSPALTADAARPREGRERRPKTSSGDRARALHPRPSSGIRVPLLDKTPEGGALARKTTKAAKATKKSRPKTDAGKKGQAKATRAAGAKGKPSKQAKGSAKTVPKKGDPQKKGAPPPAPKSKGKPGGKPPRSPSKGSGGPTKKGGPPPAKKPSAQQSTGAKKAAKSKGPAVPNAAASKRPLPKKGSTKGGTRAPGATHAASESRKSAGSARAQNVAPGRKFVKRAGAVLAQPQTPKASIRTPAGAEELKARIGALSKAVSRIRALKRNVNEAFWEIGVLLNEVQEDRLFEVKGYASFDSFVDREAGLSKRVGVALARVPSVFVREAAETAGLDRVLAALEVFDSDEEGSASVSGSGVGGRSPIPYHKQ